MDRLVTLFSGANQPKLRDAAIAFFYHGLSVIPLKGKVGYGWEKYQQERAIPETIYKWSRAGLLQNVGIVCGEVSGNLVVMDLDGQAAVDAYELQFPDLLDTFTVHTGKGKHLYYRVADLPESIRINEANHIGWEMRARGLYVVAPPSIHPDTLQPYRVPSPLPILELPDMTRVRAWLYQKWLSKQKISTPKAKRTIGESKGRTPRWAAAALNYECWDVRRAPEGTRSNQLNRAAYNLGQIVADGDLSASQVENALLIAAVASGLNEREARATIASGLQAGQTSPRSQQWQNRRKA